MPVVAAAYLLLLSQKLLLVRLLPRHVVHQMRLELLERGGVTVADHVHCGGDQHEGNVRNNLYKS